MFLFKRSAIKPKLAKTGALLFFVIVPFSLIAQRAGIAFENESWAALLAKAKEQKKYVFVDCFTTWCMPCKYMDKEVFLNNEVGTFFNNNFINVKLQMDTTHADVKSIQAQYADAAFIKNKYQITAYPTYLFFNSDGELVQIESGSAQPAAFIEKGRNALDSNKQYITQVRKYALGCRDAGFLKNVTILAKHAGDEEGERTYASAYLNTQSNLLTNDNMLFIYQTTHRTRDTGFSLMLHHLKQFEAVADSVQLLQSLKSIVVLSSFSDTSIKANMRPEQWQAYDTRIRTLYPAFAEAVLITIKRMYFGLRNDWLQYAKAAAVYANSKGALPNELNQCAWTLFLNCANPKLLAMALKWSKTTLKAQTTTDLAYMDTYANLLYKLGKRKEALYWEKKARTLALKQGANSSWGKETISKMNAGAKTW